MYRANLPKVDKFSDEKLIEQYADASHISVKYVKRKINERGDKPLFRCLCGMVLMVRGKRWGVVVLDSTEPDGIIDPNKTENMAHFSHLQKMLENILEQL